MNKALPVAVVALGAVWILSGLRAPKTPADQPQIHEFGKIPVVHNGRVKPMDTLARTTLRSFARRESFRDEKGKHPAIEWMLDLLTRKAHDHKVFKIENAELLGHLDLTPVSPFLYSMKEVEKKIFSLQEQVETARRRKENKEALPPFDEALLKLVRSFNEYQALANLAFPHVIPPAGSDSEWRTYREAMSRPDASAAMPYVQSWRDMLSAYGEGDAAKFNAAVAAYLKRMAEERPEDTRKASFETAFSRWDPFWVCTWLYLLAGVLTFFSWLGWERPLNLSAWSLMLVLVVAHTIALVIRMYLSGRPPVTNLYSSAIFIGWASVLIGLILEKIFKMGIGNLIASIAGFATLLIAAQLAVDGDTLEVLVAVLDTQFWLATHVVCITLGYAATYVAGLIGLLFILRGVLTPTLTPALAANMTRMTYGVICFATFFSFVGTVLGGLWADDSWGRFWGWDPKENGALMIVLWNVLILHARWGGMVRERGLAVLAVFGNIVVSWSWFGVNQLSVGLHNYGFTSGVSLVLWLFALSQVIVMILGMAPPERWSSRLEAKGAHAEGR